MSKQTGIRREENLAGLTRMKRPVRKGLCTKLPVLSSPYNKVYGKGRGNWRRGKEDNTTSAKRRAKYNDAELIFKHKPKQARLL